MDNKSNDIYFRRNLPHFQPAEATFFVTFRLANSIPQEVLNKWTFQRIEFQERISAASSVAEQQELKRRLSRRWFLAMEKCLDTGNFGPTCLKDDRVAGIVANAMKQKDLRDYLLHAYCIMSNHVHIVFTALRNSAAFVRPGRGGILSKIMQSLKGPTAKEANQLLALQGQFWAHESYDHVVRNEDEYFRIVKYVMLNPVKARLVDHWQDWRWSFLRDLAA